MFVNILPKETLIIIEEPIECQDVAGVYLQRADDANQLYGWGEIYEQLKGFTQLYVSRFAVTDDDESLRVEVKSVEQNNFASILSQASNSINAVNNLQNESSQLKAAYASGDKSINLSEVVLASQKSSLAFQALLQVRNKMVDAYRDVMSMPM